MGDYTEFYHELFPTFTGSKKKQTDENEIFPLFDFDRIINDKLYAGRTM